MEHWAKISSEEMLYLLIYSKLSIYLSHQSSAFMFAFDDVVDCWDVKGDTKKITYPMKNF